MDLYKPSYNISISAYVVEDQVYIKTQT